MNDVSPRLSRYSERATLDDFIVKPGTSSCEVVRQYTLTSALRPNLDGLLRDVEAALARNADIGRFIFGSFGSGKSHFLRIAGMLLANDSLLVDNARDEALRELRAAYAWLGTAELLVVNVNMMTANPQAVAFTRQLTTDDADSQIRPELPVDDVRRAPSESVARGSHSRAARSYRDRDEHRAGLQSNGVDLGDLNAALNSLPSPSNRKNQHRHGRRATTRA